MKFKFGTPQKTIMEPNQLRLFTLLRILWRWKWHGIIFTTVITGGTLLYSYSLPNLYESQTVILPIEGGSNSSSNSVESTTSAFASFIGASGKGGQAMNFQIIINSNAFQSRVVRSLNLLPAYFPNQFTNEPIDYSEVNPGIMAAACSRVGGYMKIAVDKVFVSKLTISALTPDPEFSAKLVRQYLVELQNFITDNALTAAKRYRFYLEEQLAKNKEELLEMGKMMTGFYGQYPVSNAKATLNVPVARAGENQVREFKDYEEFKRYFSVLQQKDHLSQLNEVRYVKDVPHQVYLNYVMTQQQAIESDYGMLTSAYQVAKMEEAKQEPTFRVLDEPYVAQFRSSPNRRRMVSMAFIVSLFLVVLYAVNREFKLGNRLLSSIEQL